LSSLPVSDRKLEEVITATVADPQLSMLSHVILAGWPESRKECPFFVLDFWNYRDELTFAHGLILKGNKIVIPKDLRSEMVAPIHSLRSYGHCKMLEWSWRHFILAQIVD